MHYYDYQQLPLAIADVAFAEYYRERAHNGLLDLPETLIRYCDRWCAENQAFSSEDNRVVVLNKLQAYIHDKYAAEIAELMRAKIEQFRQSQSGPFSDRRN